VIKERKRKKIKRKSRRKFMSELKKVYIKKEAFRNMITHVLKYGSKSLDNNYQVIGVCIGKPRANQDDVDVVWALPLTHGSYIDIEENQEVINNFSKNEEQWLKQGNTVIGWYCSHPDNGLNIDDQDIKNHKYFQKNYNSNSFAIVFDHKEMGKNDNLGLKIYYLGTQGFNEIDYEVEIPNTFDYFKWIMKFVEDSQLRTPSLDFFKEIGEVKSTPPDLQEIPLAPEDLPSETIEDIFESYKPIASGIQTGVEKFSETLTESLLTELNQWTTQTEQGILKGIILLRNSINQMRETVSISISKISKWFENNLDELTEDFNERISFNIDERVNTQIELSKSVSTVKEDILSNMDNLMKENLNPIIKQINNNIETLNNKINESLETNKVLESSIDSISEKINELKSNLNKIPEDINKDITSSSNISLSKLQEKFNSSSNNLNSVKDISSDLKNKIQGIQEKIKDI